MRIAIVEDEKAVHDMFDAYIDRFYQGEKSRYSVTHFYDGDEIAERYVGGFDVIFLDIQMRFMNGMTAAERIRKLDDLVPLVFVTNLAQYAIKGYGVHAFDFILKPVNYYMLEQLLIKLERLTAQKDRRYITLPTVDGLVKLPVHQIWYIESLSHI